MGGGGRGARRAWADGGFVEVGLVGVGVEGDELLLLLDDGDRTRKGPLLRLGLGLGTGPPGGLGHHLLEPGLFAAWRLLLLATRELLLEGREPGGGGGCCWPPRLLLLGLLLPW